MACAALPAIVIIRFCIVYPAILEQAPQIEFTMLNLCLRYLTKGSSSICRGSWFFLQQPSLTLFIFNPHPPHTHVTSVIMGNTHHTEQSEEFSGASKDEAPLNSSSHSVKQVTRREKPQKRGSQVVTFVGNAFKPCAKPFGARSGKICKGWRRCDRELHHLE